jgi:hypothetical protein
MKESHDDAGGASLSTGQLLAQEALGGLCAGVIGTGE